MCGISGIINFNNKPDSSTVEKMNNQIQYRGPNHSSVSSNSFSSIGIVRLSIIDLTEKSNQPFLDNERKIAPIICYESVYGEYVTEYVRKGANILAIITNDGWWSESQGYKQHLSYARIRAIETRRNILRSANTGSSAILN